MNVEVFQWRRDPPGVGTVNPGSFFDVPVHGTRVVHSDIDIARVIGGHAFSPAAAGGTKLLLGRNRIRNERNDLAVLHAADSDAPFEARILRRVGFGIGGIEDVVLVDEKATRT